MRVKPMNSSMASVALFHYSDAYACIHVHSVFVSRSGVTRTLLDMRCRRILVQQHLGKSKELAGIVCFGWILIYRASRRKPLPINYFTLH